MKTIELTDEERIAFKAVFPVIKEYLKETRDKCGFMSDIFKCEKLLETSHIEGSDNNVRLLGIALFFIGGLSVIKKEEIYPYLSPLMSFSARFGKEYPMNNISN